MRPGSGRALSANGVPHSRRLARLPERWRWTVHNLIAHPISELMYQFGAERVGDYIHDRTIPAHEPGTGRG